MSERQIKRLQPAHVRVLDLLLKAPKSGIKGASFNASWIAGQCHWSQSIVWMLLREARRFYKVDSTKELIELWRKKSQ